MDPHSHGHFGQPPVSPGSYALRGELLAAGKGAWGRWYWEAEGDALVCEDCADLDGQSWDAESDVPERVHPNCRCRIRYAIQAEHRHKWHAMHRRRGRRPGAWKSEKKRHRRKNPRLWSNPRPKPGAPKKKR